MASVEATSVRPLDARPVLPVSNETVLDWAVAIRDRFAVAMTAVLAQEKVRANLLKSEPGNYPAWIRLEAWLPAGTKQPVPHERSQFELILETKPFNRHSVVCGARLTRGKRTIAVAERARFSEHDVEEWTRHAVGRGPRPSNYRPFLDAIREPFSLIVPPLSRRYNPIDGRFRPPPVDLKTLLVAAVIGFLVAALLFRQILTPVVFAISALVLFCAVLVPILARRYRYHDWVIPQPRETPRHLGHVDSWHAVLVGLGGAAERFKQLLVTRLKESAVGLVDIRFEGYGHRTPNGYEERARLVVSHGQGHIHVHLHSLGDDLFVGWQALLNWAQWTETLPLTIIDAGRHSIAFRDVKPSWYYPSEFDLIDLNSLSAVVHNGIEQETKSLLSEHGVDQAIDFEIVRRDRGDALDARKTWPERTDKRERKSNIIFGWGAVRRESTGQMQLAPIDARPTRQRSGIAAIPAVILLPAIAVLGYILLYGLNDLPLMRFQQEVAPNFPFNFLPMSLVPVAVALAIGLWLYAGVRAINALLVIAAIETSVFCTSFAYLYVLSRFTARLNIGSLPVLALYVSGSAAVTTLCYLLAVSIWAPGMRAGRRWLAAIVLWTIWGVLASVGDPRTAPLRIGVAQSARASHQSARAREQLGRLHGRLLCLLAVA